MPATVRFVVSKLGGALASFSLVVVLGFLLFRMIPGDPVATMTRDRPTSPEQLAALRERLGLDEPMPEQFLDYVLGLLRGDLGTSYMYNRPVSEMIG